MVAHAIESAELRPELPVPVVVFLRGLPGSGKTTLCREIVQRSPDTVSLNPDDIVITGEEFQRFSASQAGHPASLDNLKYRFLFRQSLQAVGHAHDVIWDQAWTRLHGISVTLFNLVTYLQHDPSYVGFVPIIIEATLSEDIARQRIQDRARLGGRSLDDQTFDHFLKTFEPSSQLDTGLSVCQIDTNITISDACQQAIHFINGHRQLELATNWQVPQD